MSRALRLAMTLAAAGIAVPWASVAAQQPAPASERETPAMDGRLRTEIALLSRLLRDVRMPPADRFRLGHQEIAAGAQQVGTVAVARGNLDVRGRVEGDVVVLHGDIFVHPGGFIAGNAIAVDGRVRTVGGVVEGDVRSVRGITGGILARAAGRSDGAAREPVTTWTAIKMVLGWFAILCGIGVGVLLFAERNLDGVVRTLEQRFARSFWIGALAQVAAIPALLLIILALAVTLVGILLIPFAVVAYVVALAGLCTLGFLAIARFTGKVFFGSAPASRGTSLRSLFLGIAIYVSLWLLAALFVSSPVAGSILRAIALAGSWVALTFGLGATILARAGTQRAGEPMGRAAKPADDLSWQTPTPVTGVVAARRPVARVTEGR